MKTLLEQFKFSPKIRIHCWGGFGSQLNAVSLAYELKNKFPNRRIQILIRTGGIHNISFELKSISLVDFNIKEYRIYNKIEASDANFKYLSKYLLPIVKKYFLKIGISALCNSREELNSLKPWILFVRGSYNFYPSKDFLDFLYHKIKKVNNSLENNTNYVHYRLGDLLHLSSKGPIVEDRIFQQIKNVYKSGLGTNYVVLSSDPEIAREKFLRFHSQAKIEFLGVDPLQVLIFGVSGRVFIGTNSKISVWVVNLRRNLNMGYNYLPETFKDFYQDELHDFSDARAITFY